MTPRTVEYTLHVKDQKTLAYAVWRVSKDGWECVKATPILGFMVGKKKWDVESYLIKKKWKYYYTKKCLRCSSSVNRQGFHKNKDKVDQRACVCAPCLRGTRWDENGKPTSLFAAKTKRNQKLKTWNHRKTYS